MIAKMLLTGITGFASHALYPYAQRLPHPFSILARYTIGIGGVFLFFRWVLASLLDSERLSLSERRQVMDNATIAFALSAISYGTGVTFAWLTQDEEEFRS